MEGTPFLIGLLVGTILGGIIAVICAAILMKLTICPTCKKDKFE